MNKYLIIIIAVMMALLAYFYFKNTNLQETISNQAIEIKNHQSSLAENKKIYQLKLQALEAKQISNEKIKSEISQKRKVCENDEKAINIINIGVPECLRQGRIYR